jgi:hypothetical protein
MKDLIIVNLAAIICILSSAIYLVIKDRKNNDKG